MATDRRSPIWRTAKELDSNFCHGYKSDSPVSKRLASHQLTLHVSNFLCIFSRLYVPSREQRLVVFARETSDKQNRDWFAKRVRYSASSEHCSSRKAGIGCSRPFAGGSPSFVDRLTRLSDLRNSRNDLFVSSNRADRGSATVYNHCTVLRTGRGDGSGSVCTKILCGCMVYL